MKRLIENLVNNQAELGQPLGGLMFAASAMARRLFGGVGMGPGLDGLEKVTGFTLQHYDERAEFFWEGTRGHDVTQNITAMLSYIRGEPPFTLLDFGCGPGRNLKALTELGHVAIGLDGAPRSSKWRASTAVAKRGCKIFSHLICLKAILTESSPMRRFFTCRAANCLASCANFKPP